jgi:hypothetical protein
MPVITDNANKCNTQQNVTVLRFVAETLQKQQNTLYTRWEVLNAVSINFYPTWMSIQILAHGLLKTQILCEQKKTKIIKQTAFYGK